MSSEKAKDSRCPFSSDKHKQQAEPVAGTSHEVAAHIHHRFGARVCNETL